jgi:hypothetical protein
MGEITLSSPRLSQHSNIFSRNPTDDTDHHVYNRTNARPVWLHCDSWGPQEREWCLVSGILAFGSAQRSQGNSSHSEPGCDMAAQQRRTRWHRGNRLGPLH